MSKIRVNLYLDEDVYKRTKLACDALGSSVSELVGEYLRTNVEMVEVAAKTQDPTKVVEMFQENFFDSYVKGVASQLEAMRTLQEGIRTAKAKRK